MDALSELLRVIRLTSAAYIDAELTAPWAVETPPSSAIAARLAPGAERIIPYHLVSDGSCHVQLKGEAPVSVAGGEIIMFPHGDVHVLASTPGTKPLRITTEAVVQLTHPDSMARVRYGGGGARTRLICGFFACDEALSGHLVKHLPRLMRCSVAANGAASLLERGVGPSRKEAKPGQAAVLGKLSELLFVDAVRSYLDTLPEREGWPAGLRDRTASQALALIHRSPESDWTLESLSRAIGVSRTALADHFVRCTGAAPMQYLSQWRLRLAADSLGHTDRAIKAIAETARFASVAAFTRAFKREFGVAPARWRRDRPDGARPPT
jgi:AraC family transcriptional regulator, alkane utilization regulator